MVTGVVVERRRLFRPNVLLVVFRSGSLLPGDHLGMGLKKFSSIERNKFSRPKRRASLRKEALSPPCHVLLERAFLVVDSCGVTSRERDVVPSLDEFLARSGGAVCFVLFFPNLPRMSATKGKKNPPIHSPFFVFIRCSFRVVTLLCQGPQKQRLWPLSITT